jgi:hypothetical protein
MAWLYCRRESTLDATLACMRAGIPKLNAALGTDATLYHETVTVAFGTAIHRRASRPGSPPTWQEFKRAHVELFDRSRPLLHDHYDPATLTSEAARVSFVPPDRQPL